MQALGLESTRDSTRDTVLSLVIMLGVSHSSAKFLRASGSVYVWQSPEVCQGLRYEL